MLQYSRGYLKSETGTDICVNISWCICLIIRSFTRTASSSDKCWINIASADHLLSNINSHCLWKLCTRSAFSIKTWISSSDSYAFDRILITIWCPEWDSNPHGLYRPGDFKSPASTNSAIRACNYEINAISELYVWFAFLRMCLKIFFTLFRCRGLTRLHIISDMDNGYKNCPIHISAIICN